MKMKFIKNVLSRLDFKIYPSTAIVLVATILAILGTLFLPEHVAWENSYIENFQLVVLTGIMITALCVKQDRRFWIWVALLASVLFLREINYGRVFFPGDVPNSFQSWDEIGAGRIPTILYAIYIGFVGVMFFVWKLWRVVLRYVKNARLPFWDGVLFLFGLVIAEVGERIGSMVFEETFETVFYFAFFSIIILYGYRREFKLKN